MWTNPILCCVLFSTALLLADEHRTAPESVDEPSPVPFVKAGDERTEKGVGKPARPGESTADREPEKKEAPTSADISPPGKSGPGKGVDAGEQKPLLAEVTKLPTAPGANILWINPKRWNPGKTIVLVADYEKPGVDDSKAIANSAAGFKKMGFDVVRVSPETFKAESEKIRERAAKDPSLRVIVSAHGGKKPGTATLGTNWDLGPGEAARKFGESLKGVSEIFFDSCSFGGDPQAVKDIAQGSGTHVMASSQTMYGVEGEGNLAGVKPGSNFIHARPESGGEGKNENGTLTQPPAVTNPELDEKLPNGQRVSVAEATAVAAAARAARAAVREGATTGGPGAGPRGGGGGSSPTTGSPISINFTPPGSHGETLSLRKDILELTRQTVELTEKMNAQNQRPPTTYAAPSANYGGGGASSSGGAASSGGGSASSGGSSGMIGAVKLGSPPALQLPAPIPDVVVAFPFLSTSARAAPAPTPPAETKPATTSAAMTLPKLWALPNAGPPAPNSTPGRRPASIRRR